jgi:hypothetical protein
MKGSERKRVASKKTDQPRAVTLEIESLNNFVSAIYSHYGLACSDELIAEGRKAIQGGVLTIRPETPHPIPSFEFEKLGPDRFRLLSCTLLTPAGVNLRMKIDVSRSIYEQGGLNVNYFIPTTTGTPTTTTDTPYTTTTGTPYTGTTGTPYTTTTGTPTTTTGTPYTTTTGTPYPGTTGTPYTTTTGTPTTTTGMPTQVLGTPTPWREHFRASGGQEAVDLAKTLVGAPELQDEKLSDLREKLNRLSGLLVNYRL